MKKIYSIIQVLAALLMFSGCYTNVIEEEFGKPGNGDSYEDTPVMYNLIGTWQQTDSCYRVTNLNGEIIAAGRGNATNLNSPSLHYEFNQNGTFIKGYWENGRYIEDTCWRGFHKREGNDLYIDRIGEFFEGEYKHYTIVELTNTLILNATERSNDRFYYEQLYFTRIKLKEQSSTGAY